MKKLSKLGWLIIIMMIIQINLPGVGEEEEPKTALLIVDMQDFYFPGGALPLVNPEAASLNAQKLLGKFRSENRLVIHVWHKAKQGAEIHENVRPVKGEKVIGKDEVNSFKGTDLLDYLKQKKVKRLVICGMQTHMCLEAAVRAAHDFDFECIVVHDACATRDLKFGDRIIKAEDVHYSTLSTLGAYAKIIGTAAFLENPAK